MRHHLVRLSLGLALVATLACGYAAPGRGAAAAAHIVTFVTDVGGLNDNGFNHLGYLGTTTGAKKAGWTSNVIETTSPSDYEKNLTIAAQKSDLVIAVGFSFGDALQKVAQKFPTKKFVIIDYDYKSVKPAPKNILGNDFTPGQASYLAGILAAGLSKTHTIGFVGGLNVPLIVEFYAGYKAGALSYDKKSKVLASYTGSFTDQSKGKTAGLQEINQGADVIYPAAGASGLGSLAAADQNFLHPNSVVTSVVKHVEVAIASAIVDTAAGKFKAGTKLWNLANNGVGLAPYHGLAGKVPAKVLAAIAAARDGIVSGKIVVPTK
ncbi:MAG: BMP family ABC transporter substrate-binding protein [Chloroflexota bacterium]